MKTEQTTSNQIDFRKDTPPTDWLMKRVEERYGHLPGGDIKVSSDYLREFIDELSGLRCEPVCSNGQPPVATNEQLADSTTAGASAIASANGQLAPRCICSLVEQLASPDADLVVPKKTFLAIVCAAGYSQEDALAQYRNYYEAKLRDQNGPEIGRLCREKINAYNWWQELDSDEASSQYSAAGDELRALERKMGQELEAVMSA